MRCVEEAVLWGAVMTNRPRTWLGTDPLLLPVVSVLQLALLMFFAPEGIYLLREGNVFVIQRGIWPDFEILLGGE